MDNDRQWWWIIAFFAVGSLFSLGHYNGLRDSCARGNDYACWQVERANDTLDRAYP